MNVKLAPVVLGRDLSLIEDWIQRPHVESWWGDARDQIESIRKHPIEKSAIIIVNDLPLGYICWQVLTEEDKNIAGLEDLPKDLIDIDIMIGETAAVGQGIGPIVLLQLTEKLKANGIPMAGLGTADKNNRAKRAFKKAGFRLFQKFEEKGIEMCYLIESL